jgi:hypothetical protein
MAKETPVLEGLRIASPCTVSWDAMKGDDCVRHCGACRLNVYNLSSMSRREAEALVRRSEGRLCVRFFRRADGTVLTEDCPAGLRAIRRRLRLVGGAVAAMFAAILAGGCTKTPAGQGGNLPTMGGPLPPETMGRPSVPQKPVMGDVATPPQPTMGEVSAPPQSPR